MSTDKNMKQSESPPLRGAPFKGRLPHRPLAGGPSPLRCSYVLPVFGLSFYIVLCYCLVSFFEGVSPDKNMKQSESPPLRGAHSKGRLPHRPLAGGPSPLRCSYVLSVFRVVLLYCSLYCLASSGGVFLSEGRMPICHFGRCRLTGPWNQPDSKQRQFDPPLPSPSRIYHPEEACFRQHRNSRCG